MSSVVENILTTPRYSRRWAPALLKWLNFYICESINNRFTSSARLIGESINSQKQDRTTYFCFSGSYQSEIVLFPSTTTSSKQSWTITPCGSIMNCVQSQNKLNKSYLETSCWTFNFYLPGRLTEPKKNKLPKCKWTLALRLCIPK